MVLLKLFDPVAVELKNIQWRISIVIRLEVSLPSLVFDEVWGISVLILDLAIQAWIQCYRNIVGLILPKCSCLNSVYETSLQSFVRLGFPTYSPGSRNESHVWMESELCMCGLYASMFCMSENFSISPPNAQSGTSRFSIKMWEVMARRDFENELPPHYWNVYYRQQEQWEAKDERGLAEITGMCFFVAGKIVQDTSEWVWSGCAQVVLVFGNSVLVEACVENWFSKNPLEWVPPNERMVPNISSLGDQPLASCLRDWSVFRYLLPWWLDMKWLTRILTWFECIDPKKNFVRWFLWLPCNP